MYKRKRFPDVKLASLIENELQKQEICAVYNSELARTWPRRMGLEKRKQEIKRFAKQHNLAVTLYDVGLCAIFERELRPARDRELILPIPLAKRGKPQRRQT
jgi:hypothetical protein